jgi:hypothetical protein
MLVNFEVLVLGIEKNLVVVLLVLHYFVVVVVVVMVIHFLVDVS